MRFDLIKCKWIYLLLLIWRILGSSWESGLLEERHHHAWNEWLYTSRLKIEFNNSLFFVFSIFVNNHYLFKCSQIFHLTYQISQFSSTLCLNAYIYTGTQTYKITNVFFSYLLPLFKYVSCIIIRAVPAIRPVKQQ